MTRWISDPSDQEALTDVSDTDAKSALSRGLAEYLTEHVQISPDRGLAQTTLKKVVDMYAEPEVLSEYPSATVTFSGSGESDSSSMQALPVNRDGTKCLLVTASFTQDLVVEVWCANPLERSLFGNAVEEALDPVDWMCGLRLELTHYHNARATYMLKSVDYDDSDQQNMRRYRIARFTVTATVPRLRLVSYPLLDPRTVQVVTNPQDIDPDQE